MFEFAHWLRKIIQLSILTFSRRQTLFKNIQMYLKREAQNLFWSGMLDMFSLYNSFLSLKSKQCYLNIKYCCSSDFFFFIIWLMNLKVCMTSDFLFAFAIAIYIYIYLQRRQWHPTPVLLPGKSHGWRSLVGCSPGGR